MQVTAQDISGNTQLASDFGRLMARYFMEPKHREEYYTWAKQNGIEVPKEDIN